jgi:O-antigen/teichoic acid export membrane protein
MLYKIKDNFNILKDRLRNPLYLNSAYIMLNSITGSGIGFIFWIVAAKFYSTEVVGITTALLSSITLITMFSFLGFDQSIIRFFPSGDKSKLFSTAAIIAFISGTIFCLIYVIGIDIWAPTLSIIKNNFFIFYIFLIANIMTLLAGSAFLALRKAKYLFMQSLVTGTRLFLLIPFVIFGALGIFISFGVSYILALLFTLIILYKYDIHPKKLDIKFLNRSLHFSMGNYVYGLLFAVPSQIMPILVITILGAESAAYFYIAFALASIPMVIISSFATSLFVEGSYGEPLKENVKKSIKSIFLILTPVVLLLIFFGEPLLGLISQNYLNALNIFRLMLVSTFFIVFYNIFISIKRIQKDIKVLIFIGTINAILLIGFNYILMQIFGLIGIGYAWIISYGLLSLFVIIMARREKWI